MIGRILRSNATTFTFGRTAHSDDAPAFGSLVQTQRGVVTLYGLVYEIMVADDPFVRQIVAASDAMTPEKVEDMRQRRQVPVEITALAIAFRQGDALIHGIPPRPPEALQPVFPCDEAETRDVLTDFAFFRRVLACGDCPSDQLLAASLIHAAGSQPPGRDREYLTRAGRELARLLSNDPARLDAILRRLAASLEAAP